MATPVPLPDMAIFAFSQLRKSRAPTKRDTSLIVYPLGQAVIIHHSWYEVYSVKPGISTRYDGGTQAS